MYFKLAFGGDLFCECKQQQLTKSHQMNDDKRYITTCLALSTWIYYFGEGKVAKRNVRFNYGITKVLKENVDPVEVVLNRSVRGETVAEYFTNNEDMQAAVFESVRENRIYVVFRGTETRLDDRITNFRSGLVPLFSGAFAPAGKNIHLQDPHDNPKVHKGYLRDLHPSFYGILRCISRLSLFRWAQQNPGMPEARRPTVVVCGHSMGGVLSSLFGCLFACIHRSIRVRVVTFGSPAPGDAGFRHLCHHLRNLHITRVFKDRDAAVALPVLNHLYLHVGHVHFHLVNNGCNRYDTYTFPLAVGLLADLSARDHRLGSYWRHLSALPHLPTAPTHF